jgi:hypothetical protein
LVPTNMSVSKSATHVEKVSEPVLMPSGSV